MDAPGINQGQSPFWLVVTEIARGQIVAFVVFWLAMFAPVTCQYHGMMVDWFGTQPAPNMGHMVSSTSAASRTLQNHAMTPDVTLVMSLITVMLPDRVVFRPAAQRASLLLAEPVYARQRTLLPLEPPPRSSTILS